MNRPSRASSLQKATRILDTFVRNLSFAYALHRALIKESTRGTVAFVLELDWARIPGLDRYCRHGI
jgi:hypothetical protein